MLVAGSLLNHVGTRDLKKAATRQALVDAAMRLFAERGVEATSMDQIARAAGTSRTTVFNYFPYKELILCEIGARYVDEIAAGGLSKGGRQSARAMLQSLVDVLAELAMREPTVMAAVAREVSHPDPRRRQVAIETTRYPALVAKVLDQLAAEGRVRNEADRVAFERQMVDLAIGTLVRAGGDFPLAQLRNELYRNIDVFLSGAGAVYPARA
jgi:AcrR family transcriptional regulator